MLERTDPRQQRIIDLSHHKVVRYPTDGIAEAGGTIGTYALGSARFNVVALSNGGGRWNTQFEKPEEWTAGSIYIRILFSTNGTSVINVPLAVTLRRSSLGDATTTTYVATTLQLTPSGTARVLVVKDFEAASFTEDFDFMSCLLSRSAGGANPNTLYVVATSYEYARLT